MTRRKKFSVSLPIDTLDSLRTASKRENMSVNRFISKTLENYALLSLHNSEFIPIRKALLTRFLDGLSPEEIETLAEKMARAENIETILRVTNQFNIPNMLKTFEGWLRMTGFPYSSETNESTHRYIVLHDIGDKWSLYLKKLWTTTLNQIGLNPRFECTNRIFSVTIDFGQLGTVEKHTDKQVGVLDEPIKKSKKR